jgi:hypothetical protein
MSSLANGDHLQANSKSLNGRDVQLAAIVVEPVLQHHSTNWRIGSGASKAKKKSKKKKPGASKQDGPSNLNVDSKPSLNGEDEDDHTVGTRLCISKSNVASQPNPLQKKMPPLHRNPTLDQFQTKLARLISLGSWMHSPKSETIFDKK